MRMLTFAGRNTKEILRDPINLGFGLGFPLALILLLSAIQASVPVPLFELHHLTPGITVFGLAFITLFSATTTANINFSHLRQSFLTGTTIIHIACQKMPFEGFRRLYRFFSSKPLIFTEKSSNFAANLVY